MLTMQRHWADLQANLAVIPFSTRLEDFCLLQILPTDFIVLIVTELVQENLFVEMCWNVVICLAQTLYSKKSERWSWIFRVYRNSCQQLPVNVSVLLLIWLYYLYGRDDSKTTMIMSTITVMIRIWSIYHYNYYCDRWYT